MAADDRASGTDELERLRAEVARLSTDLTSSQQREAALQGQVTATADVLRVIAASPGNLQDTLTAVIQSAVRLCPAVSAGVWQVDGDEIEMLAQIVTVDPAVQVGTRLPITRESASGRAVHDRATIHVHDMQAVGTEHPYSPFDRPPGSFAPRTMVAVPLRGQERIIGSLNLLRDEVLPFTDAEIVLLESFADQAVIAIENARLFRSFRSATSELTEALEQQTAVGEVLRVIASSPTDAQPVLETIAQSAMRLSDSSQALLMIREGEHLVRRATVGDGRPERASSSARAGRLTARRATVVAFLERRTIHVPDRSDPAHLAAFPDTSCRTAVASVIVPLIHDREAIGVLASTGASRGGTARPRSRWWKRSRTRRPSPSLTPGCSRTCRRATGSERGPGAADRDRRCLASDRLVAHRSSDGIGCHY